MVYFSSDDLPQDGDEWMRQMVRQLELTEKASVVQHKRFQNQTLLSLLQHAIKNVPAYKDRLKPMLRFDGSLDLAGWQDVPILYREEVMERGEYFVAKTIPDEHLPIYVGQTSGSTAVAFNYKYTQFHNTMGACISARHFRLHGFDHGKSLASIKNLGAEKALWPNGKEEKLWGVDALYQSSPGKHFLLNMHTPVEQQVEWLRKVRPAYLISFASNLRAIALAVQQDGGEPLNLEGIMSYGEMLTADKREIITATFGINPVDCYSTRECGFLAGQSPVTNDYLVQSEVCVVEILNEKNKPCEIGQAGRVIVTVLHNYAQPFIRYATGDYAVLGGPDASGLPFTVLSKILGRERNLFRLSDGNLIQPDFKTAKFNKFLGSNLWQVAQIGLDDLEVRFVPGLDFCQMDTDGMSAYIRQLLGIDFKITYKQVSELINPRTGKHEDYICELKHSRPQQC